MSLPVWILMRRLSHFSVDSVFPPVGHHRQDVDHNGRITAKGTKALNIALTTKFAGARDEL